MLRRSRWIEAAPITAQLIESSIKLIHAESEDRISPLLADGWSGAIRVGQLADELHDSLGEPDDPETVTKAQTLMDDFEAIRNRLTIHEVRDMSSAIGFEEAVWPWLLGEVLAGGNLSDIARFLGPDEGFSTTRADFDNERCIGLAATKALILVRALVADRLELAADLQLEQLVTWIDELVATAYSQQATDSESGR